MKFDRLTMTLLGALLAGMSGTSQAGGPRGLLDSHCGCATQKGVIQKGHFAQKGTCVAKGCAQKGCAQKGCAQKGCVSLGCAQKGHVVQKGHVFQKGHIAQKGCGSKGCATKGGCGSCNICTPGILPAVVHGVDNLLNKLFCCHTCGPTKGGVPRLAHKGSIQKGVPQKGSSCGCGTSHKPGSSVVAPPDPFVDDELQAPPLDAEAQRRRLWNLPKQVSSSRRAATTARPTVKTASSKSEPRTLSIRVAQPITKAQGPKAMVKPAPVVRTSRETAVSGLQIPKNPLRGT